MSIKIRMRMEILILIVIRIMVSVIKKISYRISQGQGQYGCGAQNIKTTIW